MAGNTRRTRKIIAASLFGFSLFYFFASFRLKMGNLKNPGPGLIPMAIGFLMFAFTALHLFRVFRELPPRGEREEAPAAEGKNYRAIAGVLICTAVYPFLLEPLKFILSTLTASFVMLILLKPGKYLFSFLLSLAMAAGAFLVFSRLFGVGLPSGFLETFLFRIGGSP
jgi:Tripartite tricarboxylate transporter TctB family